MIVENAQREKQRKMLTKTSIIITVFFNIITTNNCHKEIKLSKGRNLPEQLGFS